MWFKRMIGRLLPSPASLDAVAPQHLREPPRRHDFVARRIGGVDAEVLRQQSRRFIAEGRPVRLGGRRE